MFVSAGDQIFQHQQCPTIPTTEMDGHWKAHQQQAPNCSRCASANTKFCYYNNYSLAQPRYFCKGFQRYWTKGGSLRNVLIGGGYRRSRRSRSKKQLTARNSPDSEKAGGGLHLPNHLSTSSSPEIDLAAVFARYLNRDDQSVSQGNGFESSPPIAQDVQLANSQSTTEQGQYMFEQGWQEGINSTAPRLELFDHGLLLIEDVFWSTSEDGSTLSSAGLTTNWEPMAVQLLALYSASVLDD